MWKTLKTLIVGLLLLIALSHGPASAQTTTKTTPILTTAWTSVGTGPLFLSTIGKTWYVISPTTPALGVEGFPTPASGIEVQANQIVWVRLQDESYLAAAYTYPISAGTISLGTLTNWGVAPAGGTQVANFNVNCVVGCTASTLTSFAPTGNTLAAPLTPGTGAVSSIALPAGGNAELVSNTGTTLANVRLSIGATTSTANDIPIQPGSGCILSTNGTATFINVFNATVGASINVASGTGLGSCPTGGGSSVSGGSGPLGAQPIVNSQAVNPATASVWSVTNAPATVLVSGPITVIDSVTTSTLLGSGQTQYTGVATPGSFVTTPVTAAGDIEVEASIAGGTANVNLHMEFSQGNTAWYGRGLFLDGNLAPVQINGIVGGTVNNQVMFSGTTSGFGVDFYRVRATQFTVLTGAPVVTVTIRQSNRNSGVYALNIPTAATGVSSSAALSAQGEIGGVPMAGNQTQQAGVTLAAPTAPGSPAVGGFVPTVNALGTFSATISGFTPTGNSLASPLTPGSGAVSSIGLPAGGNAQLITNSGTTLANVRLTVGSGTATANDIPIQPGAGCVLGSGSATFINVFNTTIGASINVSSGTGLGSCPTGGGGGGTGTLPNPLPVDASGHTLTVSNPAVSTFGGTGPASGAAVGTNGPGPFDPLIQAHTTIPINITTAVTTQLIGLLSGKTIYVTSWDVMAPSGNITFEYGTGTLCGTGTTALTGPEAMNGGQIGKGVGLGPVLILPPSVALCVVTSAAAQYSGSLSFTQF